MHRVGHGDEALRRHRVSIPGATYFATLCTANRGCGLTAALVAACIDNECHSLERDSRWELRCLVIMPDHLHVLVKTRAEANLSKCIARLKTKTRPALQSASLYWQSNFFEHRMRPDEPLEPVVRYMLLNPYRAHQLRENEQYRWFYLCPADAAWFDGTLDNGLPLPEWIRT